MEVETKSGTIEIEKTEIGFKAVIHKYNAIFMYDCNGIPYAMKYRRPFSRSTPISEEIRELFKFEVNGRVKDIMKTKFEDIIEELGGP